MDRIASWGLGGEYSRSLGREWRKCAKAAEGPIPRPCPLYSGNMLLMLLLSTLVIGHRASMHTLVLASTRTMHSRCIVLLLCTRVCMYAYYVCIHVYDVHLTCWVVLQLQYVHS
jgi:hypothetical protein